MIETKGMTVEVWPITATDEGLWLVSGLGPWLSNPVPADSTVHYEMECALRDAGIRHDQVMAVHSTSWRDTLIDGIRITYLAAVDVELADWPAALPIDPGLRGVIDRPLTHGPTDAPVVRPIDPGIHALRHLWALADPAPGNLLHDATVAGALGGLWLRHLANLRPALAGLYEVKHPAA